MNRREFLTIFAASLLGAKITSDEVSEYIRKRNLHDIFNELPKHLHLATYRGVDADGIIRERQGVGIIYNQKYISMGHIIESLGDERMMGEAGPIFRWHRIVEKCCKIKNTKLPILTEDYKKDIFIADASNLELPDFPCKASSRRNLGDRVYVIGTPTVTESGIREGIINDLNGFGNNSITKGCFGTDILIVPGDSGAPIVNEYFELIGLAKGVIRSTFGYFSKIENFLEMI